MNPTRDEEKRDTAFLETGFIIEKWGRVYQCFGWELNIWANPPQLI